MIHPSTQTYLQVFTLPQTLDNWKVPVCFTWISEKRCKKRKQVLQGFHKELIQNLNKMVNKSDSKHFTWSLVSLGKILRACAPLILSHLWLNRSRTLRYHNAGVSFLQGFFSINVASSTVSAATETSSDLLSTFYRYNFLGPASFNFWRQNRLHHLRCVWTFEWS